jgi:hypothetical protein
MPLTFAIAQLSALAQVVSFEGTSYPESDGSWQRMPFCTPERSIDKGWLRETVEIGECGPPPGGDSDLYTQPIESFVGVETFFLEFALVTDGNRSEIVGQAPVALAAGSFGPINYTFTIARDQAKFFRDADLPVFFFDLEPEVPHVHRLELYGAAQFKYFIDDQLVNNGVPEGAYPSAMPCITWRARAFLEDSTTRLDYLRFGRIPEHSSGDFDSDDHVDLGDYYFFHECLSSNGPVTDAGPGCLWGDMADADTDVDMRDFMLFQLAFTGSK